MISMHFNHFSKVRHDYDAGRTGMPSHIIDAICKAIPNGSNIIDLGTGTGILARQLAACGFLVTGIDSDEKMLEVARKHSYKNITYVQAPVSHMPFPDNGFNAAIASDAFHYFFDSQSITEIKRVLAPRGIFIVLIKRDKDTFKKGIVSIITKAFPEIRERDYSDYNPPHILAQAGFSNIENKVTDHQEKVPLEKAVSLTKSLWIWSQLSDKQKKSIWNEIKAYLTPLSENGIITRSMEIQFCTGINEK